MTATTSTRVRRLSSRGEPLDLVIDRDGETIELTIVRGPARHELWRLVDESCE